MTTSILLLNRSGLPNKPEGPSSLHIAMFSPRQTAKDLYRRTNAVDFGYVADPRPVPELVILPGPHHKLKSELIFQP
jgi:hypothetical protein